MKLKIILDGETYVSKSTDKAEAKEIAEQHYQNAEHMAKSKLELDSGGFMVMGEDACRRAVFIYTDEGDKNSDEHSAAMAEAREN